MTGRHGEFLYLKLGAGMLLLLVFDQNRIRLKSVSIKISSMVLFRSIDTFNFNAQLSNNLLHTRLKLQQRTSVDGRNYVSAVFALSAIFHL
jgi:hypothetical protein